MRKFSTKLLLAALALHFFFISISASSLIASAQAGQTGFDPNPLQPDFSKVAVAVAIHSYQYAPVGDIEKFSTGSATIINENGLILTNEHVVKDQNDDNLEAFEICLTFDTQKEPNCDYSASLITTNKELDLALLRIDQMDLAGKQITKLPFLDYKNTAEVKSGDKIQILGYPNNGKKTITTTQGQVSGFAYENDVRYIKTDAIVSGGNSGGTALDEKGNFIGVPTFLVSREDNLTYILDIKDANEWIEKNKDGKVAPHEQAKKILAKRRNLTKFSTEKKKYSHPHYPKFEVDITGKWQIEELNKEGVIIKNIISGQETWAIIRVIPSQYKIGKIQLDKLFEELDKDQKNLENYKRIETGFGSLKAWLVTHISGNIKFHTYFIPYGHSLIMINYAINLKNKKESEKAHDDLLKTFKIIEPPVDSVKLLETFSLNDPPFSVQRVKGWYLQRGAISLSGHTMLLEISRPDSADGVITLTYDKFSSGQKDLKNKEIFEDFVRQYQAGTYYKILTKDGNIKVDGLNGWSISTSFPGKGIEVKKQTSIYLRNGEYYFLFTYTDKDKDYDKYIEDFKKIVSTFKFGEQKDGIIIEPTPLEEFGDLNTVYKDITYHRYENEIADLRERGYFDGDYMEEFSKDRFGPERSFTRGEAIFLLIEMKFHFDERKNNLGKRNEEVRGEVVEYKYDERSKVNFRDTRKSFHPMQYIRYAKAKGFVKGDAKNKFHPYQEVTLGQFLSMAFHVFEVPLWETKNKGIPWYKILMDKAYEKGLIPAGIFDMILSSSSNEPSDDDSSGKSLSKPFVATHIVTRGEFSYIVNQLLIQLGDN